MSHKVKYAPKELIVLIGLPLAVAAFAFLIYLPRTALTPQASDGPELTIAAFLGGLAHPPGYPLYSLLAGKLTSLFPDNPYATLSAFSATAQALATGLLTFLLFLLSRSWILSVSLAFGWFLWEPTVRAATDVEVFALHNLLLVGFLLSLFVLWNTEKRHYLSIALVGLLFGLAAAHHHMVILWAPLLVCVFFQKIWVQKKISFISSAGTFLLTALPGASLYLSFPDRSANAPEYSFDLLHSPGDLILYVLRAGYGTFSVKLEDGSSDVSYLPHFLSHVLESLPISLFLSAGLLIFLFRKDRMLAAGLLLTGVLHYWFLDKLIFPAESPHFQVWVQRFYSPVALFLVISSAFVAREPAERPFARACITFALLLPIAFSSPRALTVGNTRANFTVVNELIVLSRDLPMNAVYFAETDKTVFGFQYFQQVRNERSDVLLVPVGVMRTLVFQERLSKNSLLFEADDIGMLSDEEMISIITERAKAQNRPVWREKTQP